MRLRNLSIVSLAFIPTPALATTYVCEACPAGTWGDGTNCNTCKAGTYAYAGASSCTSCLTSGVKSCDSTTGKATSCKSGFGLLSSGACARCSAGTYSPGGTGGCYSCSSGYYSNAGASSCTKCPAGKYSSSIGSSSCTSCAAGTYSTSGASSCTNCPAGTYSTAGASKCINCSTKNTQEYKTCYTCCGNSETRKLTTHYVPNSTHTECVVSYTEKCPEYSCGSCGSDQWNYNYLME